MKKTDMIKIVEDNKKLNETELATLLLENGATFQQLSLLNRVMIDLGLKKDETAILKDVKKAITKPELDKLDSYRSLREYAEKLDTQHAVGAEKIMTVVRRELKHHKIDVPKKTNLGAIKSVVISYFKDNEKPDVDELIKAIVKDASMTEEKAKLHASQLYQLGVLLHNNQTLADVN